MSAKTPVEVFDQIEKIYRESDRTLTDVVREFPIKVNYHTVQREMKRRMVPINLEAARRETGKKNAVLMKHRGGCVDCGQEVLERYTRCRSCLAEHRSWMMLLKTYGLTKGQYFRLAAQQGGVCAICKRPPVTDRYHDRLRVDHCHETNKIRGLLCQSCNVGLGHLGDTSERVWAALAYLERAEA